MGGLGEHAMLISDSQCTVSNDESHHKNTALYAGRLTGTSDQEVVFVLKSK